MQKQLRTIKVQIESPPGTPVSVTVAGLDSFNIIVGKNGCGKSSLLKAIESFTLNNRDEWGRVEYITPERGGVLLYEANIDQAVNSSPSWRNDSRRVNQLPQFKQQSYTQFLNLERAILREIETNLEKRGDFSYTFAAVIDKINGLLDNIRIERQDVGFKIYRKDTGGEVESRYISSGESELIALGIECMIFSRRIIAGKNNLLLLDEPDVHLHPDLQARLMAFLKELVNEQPFMIIIATHSTAILGELSDAENASVAFMRSGKNDISFASISEGYKKILPVFGAHPLSNVFNHAPILIVEGEDDERIWQQAVRTSKGRIRLYPVPAGSVTEMIPLEAEAKQIIEAVYDDAKAYSLRDGDECTEEMHDLPPITRMRLSCRAAENLILSDDVLNALKISWNDVRDRIEAWLLRNQTHTKYAIMKRFVDEGYKRKEFDLKELRLIIVDIMGSNKPWEVLVGQVLATRRRPSDFAAEPEGSMVAFLGQKVAENLLPR